MTRIKVEIFEFEVPSGESAPWSLKEINKREVLVAMEDDDMESRFRLLLNVALCLNIDMRAFGIVPGGKKL